MLSILIPTYNYYVLPLVEEIKHQALQLNVPFEIICVDDASFAEINVKNQNINSLTNSKFIESKKNRGSIGNRKYLASLAQYNWLLFLDADTKPDNTNFLKNFLNAISQEPDVIFGGIIYPESLSNNNTSLRWHYGKERESKTVAQREKDVYRSIILGCFAIRKNLFVKVCNDITENRYGLDIIFTYLLLKEKAKTQHIHAPVYHLGLESNLAYLDKSKSAVKTLFWLYKNKFIPSSYSKLLKYYNVLNTFGVSKLFNKVFSRFKQKIENNLMSENPSLFYFDIYRLAYLCGLNSSNKSPNRK